MLEDSPHVIVTRFAVPRAESDTDGLFCDPDWLRSRVDLFRRFYVPSVGRLGVPAVLLCGTEAAERVSDAVADVPWAHVVVQDGWHDGWTGGPHQTLTRFDSDDAVHKDWLRAVDDAPADAPVVAGKRFLRWDIHSGRLHKYRRKEASPLAAFRGGVNPYRTDHRHLERDVPGTFFVDAPYLLQVVHGGNIANRRPSPWRIDRRVPLSRLADFGLDPSAGAS